MTIHKSTEFFAPYIAKTFNDANKALSSVNGVLYGAEIAVTAATTVTIGPYGFIQNGLIVEQNADTLEVVVPDYSTNKIDVHLIVASPNEKDSSGVTITAVEGIQGVTSTAIVLASRINGTWVYPQHISLNDLLTSVQNNRIDGIDGRVSGAELDFSTTFGTNQAAHLKTGVITEGTGGRRILSIDGALDNGVHQEFDITSVDPDFNRTDHVISRRRSDNPFAASELILAKGETIGPATLPILQAANTPTVTVDSTAGNTKPSVVDNSAGQHVVCWGNSSNVWRARLAHTTTRTVDTPDSLAAGGTVSDVYITARPGITSSERIFGVCTAGGEIFLFRTDAGGAALVSGVVLTSTSGKAAKPHMVIDPNNYAYIVYQVDAGTALNQVYYIKYNLDDSVFGTGGAVAVSARYARGYSTGQNDITPQVAFGNDGNVHIVFVHATTPNVYGDINYLVISQAGTTVEAEYAISSTVNDGTGGTETGTTLNVKPKIAVSPQGDVYISYVGDYNTTPKLIIFDRSMQERTGFDSVKYYTLESSDTVYWHNLASDELGRPMDIMAAYDSSGTAHLFGHFKFGPVLVSNGSDILPDILNKSLNNTVVAGASFVVGASGETDECGEARIDRDGSIQIVDVISNVVTNRKFSSASYIGFASAATELQHPKDSYLGTVSLAYGSSDTVNRDGRCDIHPRRIKSQAPIIAVGRDGDYAGFYGIQQAINSLRGKGGSVIIKAGVYRLMYMLRLWSGIKLYADGNVVFNAESTVVGYNFGIYIGGKGGLTIATNDATNWRFGFSNLGAESGLAVGDMVYVYDDALSKPKNLSSADLYGPYYITRLEDDENFTLNADISTPMGGMTTPKALWYTSGNVVEGITINDDRAASTAPLVVLYNAHNACMRNLTLTSTSADPLCSHISCFGARWDGCTFTADTADEVLNIDGSTVIRDIYTIINDCRFTDGDISIGSTNGYNRLKISNCALYNASNSWIFGAAADEAPIWTNNAGVISATSFDSINTWSENGSVFANRLILNQYSGITTPGNVRGSLIPVADRSENLGTLNHEWGMTRTKTSIIRPDNESGLILEGSQLDDWSLAGGPMGYIGNMDNKIVHVLEGTGRIAPPNKFEDDFQYGCGGAAGDYWINSGTVQGANIPFEYKSNISVSVAAATVNLIPMDKVARTGNATQGSGALMGQIGSAVNEYMFVVGPASWMFDNLSTNNHWYFMARYMIMDVSGTDDLNYRKDMIGIIHPATSYVIAAQYDGVSGLWKLLLDNGSTALATTIPGPVSGAVDTWMDIYIRVRSTDVTAWVTGASTSVTATFGSGGNPAAPSAGMYFGTLWYLEGQSSSTGNKVGLLDYWSLHNNNPMSAFKVVV